jgi:hypothetical protein
MLFVGMAFTRNVYHFGNSNTKNKAAEYGGFEICLSNRDMSQVANINYITRL